MSRSLQEQFGQIDIYVFDQILRGNITPGMRVVDAGCGSGRNLIYLLRQGTQIFAIDQDYAAVDYVKTLAAALGTGLPPDHFIVAPIERIPLPHAFADVVLCNSVLHFARNTAHFHAMLAELWRILKPGGMLFTRLGSRIGMDFEQLGENIYRIGDGSPWFLVHEQMLLTLTQTMNATLVDPLKTTIVQNHRCMTTWVLRKPLREEIPAVPVPHAPQI